jgi:glutaconate CoA-transferase subunit B
MMDKEARALMTVVLARQVRDGDRVGAGVQSGMAVTAAILAVTSRAPRARLSLRGMPGTQPLIGSREFTGLVGTGKIDLFFFSAVQVDAMANINTQYVEGGGVRRSFYGAFAAPMYYPLVERAVVYRAEHSRRVFVPRVDYVTASRFCPEREEVRARSVKVVTGKAVLSFESSSRRMRLETFHPWETVDSVLAATGFELLVGPGIRRTAGATDEELAALWEAEQWVQGRHDD